MTPVQNREQTRPSFSPSAPVPRPTEEQFRPALIGSRPSTVQAPPRQFVQAPPLPPAVRAQTSVLSSPQQRQPIVSPQLPVKPQLGRPIVAANPAPANFAPAPISQSNRAKPIQPECNLFSEGICLDVRNYPTYNTFSVH